MAPIYRLFTGNSISGYDVAVNIMETIEDAVVEAARKQGEGDVQPNPSRHR
jgi:hypothetical protein